MTTSKETPCTGEIPVTAWGCSVTVVVGVGDGALLVGGGVAMSVGGGLPVGSTVLMLLVVLGPVAVYNIHCKKFV